MFLKETQWFGVTRKTYTHDLPSFLTAGTSWKTSTTGIMWLGPWMHKCDTVMRERRQNNAGADSTDLSDAEGGEKFATSSAHDFNGQ